MYLFRTWTRIRTDLYIHSPIWSNTTQCIHFINKLCEWINCSCIGMWCFSCWSHLILGKRRCYIWRFPKMKCSWNDMTSSLATIIIMLVFMINTFKIEIWIIECFYFDPCRFQTRTLVIVSVKHFTVNMTCV